LLLGACRKFAANGTCSTNEDALLHRTRIEGRYLVGPSGVRWSVLVLPATHRVSLPVLQLVERYLQAGGVVVSLPPTSSTGNITSEQERFTATVERLWKHCTEGTSHAYAAGKLFCAVNTHASLVEMNVTPDVELTSSEVRLGASSANCIDSIDRRSGDIDIYFVRSAYSQAKSFSIAFRLSVRLSFGILSAESFIELTRSRGTPSRLRSNSHFPPTAPLQFYLPTTSRDDCNQSLSGPNRLPPTGLSLSRSMRRSN
jgi:hypothetical protein